MLTDLINKLWRGGLGPWKQDYRYQAWVNGGKPNWTIDEAIQAIQLETRIAERFHQLSSQHQREIVELTAALIGAGEIPAPIREGYMLCY